MEVRKTRLKQFTWLFYSLIACLFGAFQVFAEDDLSVPDKTEKNGYIEPFQMFDNLYYVGDKWVSAYLLETEDGLTLIDTLEFPFSKWLPDNIAKLGFSVQQINTIFITHGHSDHAGGAGFMQQLTHADVVMLKEDSALLRQQAGCG